MIEAILWAIRLGVTIFVMFLWTFVGLVLWIPLLLRVMAYFTAMVAVSSFTRNVSIKEVQNRLNFAIEFYVYGYRRIWEVAKQHGAAQGELHDTPPLDILDLLKDIALDMVWTFVFWISIAAVAHSALKR